MGKVKGRPWQCFEEEVFEAVKKALRVEYGLPAELGQIRPRRNAEYIGSSGNKYKLEISVEFYRLGANEPHLIWLWECKRKAARKVGLGDVAELAAKLDDIGTSRSKGSIVTTIGYQKGARNLAEKHGITLCLLRNDLEYVSRFTKEVPTTARPVIYVQSGIDFKGDAVSEVRFPDYVRECVRDFAALS
jgi:hypothetical protein